MTLKFDVIITRHKYEGFDDTYNLVYVDCQTTNDHVFVFGEGSQPDKVLNGNLDEMTKRYDLVEAELAEDGWVELETKIMSFSAEPDDILSKAKCFDGMLKFIEYVFEHDEALKIVNRVIRLSDKFKAEQPKSELYTHWGVWA